MQEEPPEDYYVLQRNQGKCGPKIPQGSMRDWAFVIFRNAATME